ncbi:helix-turn-helix transcriptional regulator [Nocardiopsis potens]|uniref:helix-turn-helix transcriptional regulator n=1 Tax=Nocardiopsis potens TaxID=1246458 RepID=UPI00034DAF9A|nr:helix-turn-helix domain-containing protein [Nocardiopsis potens]
MTDDSVIDAAGLLADPTRRRLYRYVTEQGEAGRAEAADALGIRRTLAAFHLDRLAEAGLLAVELRKVSGREGPGSGRPAKLYRRADREFGLHLPPRDYASAAHLLAEAVERSGAEEALYAAAREEGARRAAERGADAPRTREELAEVLRGCGYEPAAEGGRGALRLRNCPFHSLAAAHPPLACGMNLELLRALVAGYGTGFTARMAPRSGEGCCVEIVPDSAADSKNNED